MAHYRARVLALLVLTLPLPTQAADTLFSTLGPGDSYSTSRTPITGASTFLGYLARGMRFSSGLERVLTTLELPLQHSTGTNSYLVRFQQDAAGQPGTVLESWTASAPSVAGIVTLASSSKPLLQSGGVYWVTLAAGAATTNGGWFLNSQGLSSGGSFARNSPSGTWTTTGGQDMALRVTGSVAPEPTSLAVFLAGTWVVLGRHRRRTRC